MTHKISGRLHYLDTLRAFVMSIGIVLHAGLVASFWLPKAINYVSGMFRMSLFVFIAGFFVSLLLERRSRSAVIKDRLIRFGVPAMMVMMLVSWIDHYYFYNMLVEPRSFRAIVTDPPKWNVAGFDWPHAPRFMTWHGQMWFLLIAMIYCAALPLLLRVGSSRWVTAAVQWLVTRRSPSTASLILGVTMATLYLSGRVFHFATTQQLLGGGPFNFIAQMAWLYAPWFMLGLLSFRNEQLFELMHKVHVRNVAIALAILVAATLADGPLRARTGMIGGESVEYFSKGLMGFYICKALLALFRRFGNDHSPVIRFVADASYTVYLFHISVIACYGYYVRLLDLGPALTWLTVIVLAYPTCLLIHRSIVDRSPLTRFLFNGKPFAAKRTGPVRQSA